MRAQVTPAQSFSSWIILLWYVTLSGTLVYWPFCPDYTHVPRFLALSGSLLVAWWWLRKDLQQGPGWNFFDALLLLWYGWSLVSVSWSLSVSEGIFYAQKNLLLLLTYRFFRHALHQDSVRTRGELGHVALVLTVVYGSVIFFQLAETVLAGDLNNEALYAHIGGYLGNKSLAAEYLVLLLALHALAGVYSPWSRKLKMPYWLPVLVTGLILVLQVRTALLALLAGAAVYVVARAAGEPTFRPVLRKKILPVALILIGIASVLMAWKGRGNDLAERLNPLQYLDSDTAKERRFVWAKTDLINADHFWLGVGSGSWKFWLPSKSIEGGYRLTEGNVVFTRAHNDYLEVRSETGIIGVVLFCGMWVLAFWLGGKALHKTSTPGLAAAMGGCAAYCVIQYFDFPRERMEFQVLLAIFFALMVHQAPSRPVPRPGILWVLGLLGLSLATLIGFYRIKGEVHLNKMMDAQVSGNWRGLLAEARKAENPWLEYTDSATPIAWHEGVALYQLGQFDASVTAFDRAYQLNPWSFQVINNYASALVKVGKHQNAIPLYEKALGINPRYDEGKFNLSFVYSKLGDTLRARSWLDKIDTIPNAQTPADKEQNRVTLKRLGEFRAVIK
ncbi:MAG: O-antigen ligase family protein [Saprospiraceae bacterium]|nr:O-antigen ligase family protein [Saprospiraceae bacterium]